MIILRCTQRLLKQSSLKPSIELPIPTAVLGEWYVNVIGLPFRGRTVVLYVQNPTRLAVMIPGRSVRTTVEAFRARVPVLLQLVGVDPESINSERIEMNEVAIGRTQDRRILGTMADQGKLIYFHAEDAGSMDRFDLQHVELNFSRMPHVSADIFPDKAVRELFARR